MSFPKVLLYSFLFILISSCAGRLPSEDVEGIQQELKERKIFRVTDREISAYIQNIIDSLKIHITERNLPQSNTLYKVIWVDSLTTLNDVKGQAVIDAYDNTSDSMTLPENLQVMDNGNILYTLPIAADSTAPANLLAIEFIKKEVIRKMTLKK